MTIITNTSKNMCITNGSYCIKRLSSTTRQGIEVIEIASSELQRTNALYSMHNCLRFHILNMMVIKNSLCELCECLYKFKICHRSIFPYLSQMSDRFKFRLGFHRTHVIVLSYRHKMYHTVVCICLQ